MFVTGMIKDLGVLRSFKEFVSPKSNGKYSECSKTWRCKTMPKGMWRTCSYCTEVREVQDKPGKGRGPEYNRRECPRGSGLLFTQKERRWSESIGYVQDNSWDALGMPGGPEMSNARSNCSENSGNMSERD